MGTSNKCLLKRFKRVMESQLIRSTIISNHRNLFSTRTKYVFYLVTLPTNEESSELEETLKDMDLT